MANEEAGLRIAKLLVQSSPQSLAELKAKAKKLKYTNDVFMGAFDYAIDKGWIEEIGSEVRITDRGLEEAGPAL